MIVAEKGVSRQSPMETMVSDSDWTARRRERRIQRSRRVERESA